MSKELEQFILQAIKEDIGDGDHTSKACVPLDMVGKMKLLVKQKGVLAGVSIAEKIFKAFDPSIEFEQKLSDGTKVDVGDIAFYISGPEQILLQAERLVLNVMQRMSGIATQTRVYVDTIKGTKTQILDTRKTTPLNRFLEKEAVKIGGGNNHRFGLYDMIMIKDNHVDFAGGITKAVYKVQDYLKLNNKTLKVELEVRNFEELKEALSLNAIDRIMLDNFSVEDTKKALNIIDGRVETESSGGITLETIRAYAETGVDYISVGALTHQIMSLDLSLKAVE
jgi:nicotinate-nucleotide pyrophosphorylase (carboxylating)